MDPAFPLERRRSRFPKMGFACLAIPAVLLGITLLKPKVSSSEDYLGLAKTRGLVPPAARPALGTKMYQWDPDLEKFPPLYLGMVTSLVSQRGKLYARIKSPNRLLDGSALEIEPGALRYWVEP